MTPEAPRNFVYKRNMSLTESVLEGNRLALARLLTQVENDSPEGRAALAELFPHTGKAHLIGITGAPGTGKSSLVNQLALHYRKNADKKVAIVAVDPSSPFTGGAVLGDRVRMRDLSGDNGVFIRSMAIARFAGRHRPKDCCPRAGLRCRGLRDHHHRNGRRGTERSGCGAAGAYHRRCGSTRSR